MLPPYELGEGLGVISGDGLGAGVGVISGDGLGAGLGVISGVGLGAGLGTISGVGLTIGSGCGVLQASRHASYTFLHSTSGSPLAYFYLIVSLSASLNAFTWLLLLKAKHRRKRNHSDNPYKN